MVCLLLCAVHFKCGKRKKNSGCFNYILYQVYLKYLDTFIKLKYKARRLERSLKVRNFCFSFRGPGFGSQHSCDDSSMWQISIWQKVIWCLSVAFIGTTCGAYIHSDKTFTWKEINVKCVKVENMNYQYGQAYYSISQVGFPYTPPFSLWAVSLVLKSGGVVLTDTCDLNLLWLPVSALQS